MTLRCPQDERLLALYTTRLGEVPVVSFTVPDGSWHAGQGIEQDRTYNIRPLHTDEVTGIRQKDEIGWLSLQYFFGKVEVRRLDNIVCAALDYRNRDGKLLPFGSQ